VKIESENKRVTTHNNGVTHRVPGGMRLFPIIWTRLLIIMVSHWSTPGVDQSEPLSCNRRTHHLDSSDGNQSESRDMYFIR